MNSRRIAWVPLVVACAISAAYVFGFGVDWGFTVRSRTVPSAILTALILSAWASVPYLILSPIARKERQSLFTILVVLVILAFGMFAMDRARRMPGDAGGSYIVVPFEQMLIAAVVLFGWRRIRRIVH